MAFVGIGFDVSSNIGTGYALDISGTLIVLLYV